MSRQISSAEVRKHSSNGSAWLIIHHEVYDVTKFLEEHPGGVDSLLEYAGKDGSQAFEDVGHSEDARELMQKYKIGKLPADEIPSPTYGFVPHQNREVIVFPASSFDKSEQRKLVPKVAGVHERSSSPLNAKGTDEAELRLARPDPRVIVVPRERTERKPKPSSSCENNGSKLKWAALALASVLVAGFAVKKYLKTLSVQN